MAHPALAVDNYLPYMPDVVRCETSLRELNVMWRLIESTARMVCPTEAQAILPTIAATRSGFDRLESELVRSLVSEKIDNVMSAIATRAGYIIDIVVRNLYERTADVGFLAIDRVLCEFVAGQVRDVDAVRARLRSYRRKYTVYDEIFLLDTEGNVLVQTDPAYAVEGTQDPLLAQALQTDGYVQVFRPTDLRPGLGPSLMYAQRMLHPSTHEPVGVLCLVFGFETEMAGIFRSHRDPRGRSIMLLLDGDGTVLASADEHWIPRGVRVPTNPDDNPRLLLFAGREYLVATRYAEGYQGYRGPEGWQGQVMIPIDLAFQRDDSSVLDALDPMIAAGLLSHARNFSPPLYEVIRATESIRRVVWNGQVVTAGRNMDRQRLKTILDQISETGARSNTLFSHSVRDLYETVLSSSLQQIGLVAHLAVDLLDRNLYERADDCRWWALTPEFRTILAQDSPDPGAFETIRGILRYIHSLYTVYSRLFVYDRQGRIVAQSHAGGDDSASASSVDAETLQAVLALDDEQRYHVSPFRVDPLSDGQATYTYHAAIRHPDDERRVVGGIGIVFNARREFLAMLQGAIGGRRNAHAHLTDRQGRLIATTHPELPIGEPLPAAMPWLGLPNGETVSRIVEHEGRYAVLGASASAGYREFKTTDGYRDDVIAIVIEPLGDVREGLAGATREHDDWWTQASARGGHEYATFYLGGDLLAIDAACVREAVPADQMTSAPATGHPALVGLIPPTANTAINHFIWVYDLARLLNPAAPARSTEGRQIIVLERGAQVCGILVDELHAVPEFEASEIIDAPFGGSGRRLIDRLIRARGGQVLIAVLDNDRLFTAMRG